MQMEQRAACEFSFSLVWTPNQTISSSNILGNDTTLNDIFFPVTQPAYHPSAAIESHLSLSLHPSRRLRLRGLRLINGAISKRSRRE